jgi:hypothetical protein
MSDTIKVPGVGPVDQRWVIASGALVAGIVGFAWWHRGLADAAPADASATDPGLFDGSAGADDGAPWPFRPGVGGSTVDDSGAAAGTAPPTTNAQWSQEAVDKLESAGWERNKSAAVLGKYLARTPLAPDEVILVHAAIALEGPPPQGSYSVVPAPPTAPPRTPPTATAGPPAGPYRYMKTTRTLHTVPTIAVRFGLLSATVLKYNPEIAQRGYDPHNLPVGLVLRLPK